MYFKMHLDSLQHSWQQTRHLEELMLNNVPYFSQFGFQHFVFLRSADGDCTPIIISQPFKVNIIQKYYV